jgi:hypothetical protein
MAIAALLKADQLRGRTQFPQQFSPQQLAHLRLGPRCHGDLKGIHGLAGIPRVDDHMRQPWAGW